MVLRDPRRFTMAIDKKFTDGYVNLRFDGVVLRWAKVQKGQFDQYTPQGAPAGEKKWVTDIRLNDKLAKSLKAEGFNVKKDKDGYFLSASKKCEKKDGTPNNPVLIVGKDGKTIVENELGNGTVANVKVVARKWGTVSTITVYLDAIQVVDLVEFSGKSGFDAIEDGDDEPSF